MKRAMTSGAALLLAALAALLHAAPVAAQDAGTTDSDEAAPDEAQIEEARARFELGTAYYRQGRFEDAAREFLASYEITNHPTLLHNIYLCYRDLGQTEEAVSWLERYLRDAADLEPSDRTVLEGRLAAMQRTLAARGGQEPAPGPDPDPEIIDDGPVPDVAPDAPPVEADSADGGGPDLVPGGVITGIGGAALAAALVMRILAQVEQDDFESTCSLGPSGDLCPGGFDQEGAQERFDAYVGAAWGLMIGGAVVTTVGVVLMAVAASGGEQDVQASFGCDAHGCGASLRGVF